PKNCPDACPRPLPAGPLPEAAAKWREHPRLRTSGSQTWDTPPFRLCPFMICGRGAGQNRGTHFFEKKPAQPSEPAERVNGPDPRSTTLWARRLFHKPQGGHANDDRQNAQKAEGLLGFLERDHAHHRSAHGSDPRP